MKSEQLAAIVASLSRARMSTYASLAGDDPAAALRLYERNMRMSEAFYTPLQCLEVCLRNKLHDRLSEVYGDRWFEDPRIGFAPGVLKSIALAAGTVCKAGKALTPGAIVAELSFGFWVGILATTYDETLWRRSLARAFRPDGRGLKRQVVHGRMNMLRRFRNRVAHHEPIFGRDLDQVHQELIEAIGWMCPETARWVAGVSQVCVSLR